MQNRNSKETSKLIIGICIAASLLCALVSGLLGGVALATNHPIYATIFIAVGFAHANAATKAWMLYRQV